MPPELTPVLVQFPVVALVFAGAWVVLKWADRRHAAELLREQVRYEAAERRAEVERTEARAAERRLAEWMGAEITRLRSQNTRLQNRRNADREPPPWEDEP